MPHQMIAIDEQGYPEARSCACHLEADHDVFGEVLS